MTGEPADEVRLLREAGAERGRALGDLLERHRARLLRMLELRMDPALRARVGASDVLQEAFLEVQGRLEDWLRDPSMPFYLWVRFLAVQRLLKARRHHLGAKRRDARRDARDDAGSAPPGAAATTAGLVEGLAASGVSPSGVAVAAELRLRLNEALEALEPLDREVLALRHLEELSNAQTAEALGIRPDAASKRYLRALERLRRVLGPSAAGPRGPGA